MEFGHAHFIWPSICRVTRSLVAGNRSEIGNGSRCKESMIFREGAQRVTAGIVVFLCGDKGLMDKATEVRRGIE